MGHPSLCADFVVVLTTMPFLCQTQETQVLWKRRMALAGGRSKTPHDDITYRRVRGEKGEVLSSIPQAERYSSQDWLHNIVNIPGSQVWMVPPKLVSSIPGGAYSFFPLCPEEAKVPFS